MTAEQPNLLVRPREDSLYPRQPAAEQATSGGNTFPAGDRHLDRVMQLEAENLRLRHLVAELLATNQRIRGSLR